MLFLESSARPLLICHAILGASLVGVASLLWWRLRAYSRGRFDRHPELRRLGWAGAGLFLLTLLTGQLLQPIYAIRVRGEFLDSGDAIAAEYRIRLEARARFWQRQYGSSTGPAAIAGPADGSPHAVDRLPRRTARLGRWFDVKQHWAALGLIAAAALGLLLARWKPERDPRYAVPVIRLLATGTAAIAWFAAIVGLLVASYRSVGSFG